MQEAKQINCIDISYAGGEKGMDVTQKIIDECAEMLKPVSGTLYIFLIEENGVAEIVARNSMKF